MSLAKDIKRAQRADKLLLAKKFDEAEPIYVDFLRRHPNNFAIWNQLGKLRQYRGDAAKSPKERMNHFYSAAECYEKAIQLPHDDMAVKADAMNNFGTLMVKVGHPEKANICFKLSREWDDSLPHVLSNHHCQLVDEGKLNEADAELARALEIDPSYPDAKYHRGLIALVLGNLEKGFEGYDHRFNVPSIKVKMYPTDKPKWEGEDLKGKTILLTGEQGLGDQIMFIRYAKMVKALGARVLFHGHELLRELFAGVEGLDEFVKPEAEESFDYHSPLLSLPKVFKTRLGNIPGDCPYIHKQPSWSELPDTDLMFSRFATCSIGIVWAGSPIHGKDAQRSVPPETFQPLIDAFPQVSWFSLQVGPRAAECSRLMHITDLSPALSKLEHTAQALERLDLLISVDTSIVHLAGALNRPVWMLTPFSPDWRWMLERNDSPWYPSLRLFRQPARGDWATVMQAVQTELARRL